MKKLITTIFIFNILLLIGLSSSKLLNLAQAQSQVCPDQDGWTKLDDLSGKSKIISPENQELAITEVCVKGGHESDDNQGIAGYFYLTSDGESDCVTVEGLNTTEVSIAVADSCAELSHISYLLADPEVPTPSSTPTPAVEPSATPTPNPTPTADPTAVPTLDPTATPTQEPKKNKGQNKVEDESDEREESKNEGSKSEGELVEETTITTEQRGQVLGATTDSYADTGVATDILMSVVGLSGVVMTSFGISLKKKQ